MKPLYKVFLFSLILFLLLYSNTNGSACINGKDTTLTSQWIQIDPVNLPIIPPSSGVSIYREGMIFLSSTKYGNIIPNNHISFGKPEIMLATLKDGKPVSISPFSPAFNFSFPVDAITFTKDYKTMYFTRFDRSEKAERIYRGDFIEKPNGSGSWDINSEPLSFCIGNSSYTHPALSSDGEFMVFASNREGSLGGMDLFVTTLKDGEWTGPVNMGETVNSRSSELYPWLDRENNLYFSSDRIEGFGGYDIYICRYRNEAWEKPVRLLPPINTPWDDIAFTGCNSGETAFYTVGQNKGKKSQRLYMISLDESKPDTLKDLSQYFTSPEISCIASTDVFARNELLPATQPTSKADLKRESAQKKRVKVKVEKKADQPVKEKIPANKKIAKEVKTNQVIPPVKKTKQEDGITKEVVPVEKTKVEAEASSKQVVKDDTKIQETGKVIYRVQLVSNNAQKGSYKIKIGGKEYNTWEYKYAGAWRTTAGEFLTLSDAVGFQRLARQSGFEQAFVAAFVDDVRSTDPELFKK